MPHVERTRENTRALPRTSYLVPRRAQRLAVADLRLCRRRDGRRRRGERLTPAYDALLTFLHYRLLPYLAEEERELTGGRLRDHHMTL